MDEEDLGVGLVPPSPVATSTQIEDLLGVRNFSFSQSFGEVIPPLPRLPDLQHGVLDDDITFETSNTDRLLTVNSRHVANRLPTEEDLVSDVSSVHSEVIDIDEDSSDVQVIVRFISFITQIISILI
ncbi:hypothetical protein ACF0H5_015931 [Mactra antiquata]